MGVGVAVTEKKYLEEALGALAQVTGQKPIATLSKAAVSGFKLRENLPIGCKVTLRGRRMYEFLDRLVSLALPRVRDFRGLSSTAFDGHGNYSLGLSEQMVFPDINPDKWGKFTPGTGIPIVSEEEAREMRPEHMLVLPWHFKEGIVKREQEFLERGGRLIFPLPEIEIVGF
jgi:large subunit ribosomal protein L5